MIQNIKLNVSLLKRSVPNLTVAAKSVGLRPATVSNLCTGKIPISRAEVKTLVSLANMAGCSLDDLIIYNDDTETIETGIKVLDLFAPLVRGGTIGFVARPGMGQLVLMAEIFARLKKDNYITMFLMPNEETKGIEDVQTYSDYCTTDITQLNSFIEKIPSSTDIVLAVDRTMVETGDLFDLKEQFQKMTTETITFLVVDTTGSAVDEDAPYGPLETLWRFDMDLSARRMYPAVDPVQSTSTVLEGAHLQSTHLTIQQKARKLLRRYKELRFIVQNVGMEKLSHLDKQVYERGQRLEAFFTQPFYVAESVTKQDGEWVKLNDTLEHVRKLLDGAADDIAVDDLLYIGELNI